MQERIRKGEEQDRLLAKATSQCGSETESDESDGSGGDRLDYQQEIQKFKQHQLKKRIASSSKDAHVSEFKKQCQGLSQMAGGGCPKRKGPKLDTKFETALAIARSEAI